MMPEVKQELEFRSSVRFDDTAAEVRWQARLVTLTLDKEPEPVKFHSTIIHYEEITWRHYVCLEGGVYGCQMPLIVKHTEEGGLFSPNRAAES